MTHGDRYADELERDFAVTAAQYMLSPDIPFAEKKHFEKFYLMFSKIMALGNIREHHVLSILIAFEEVCILLEMGLYDDARKLMGKELMKMQISRSIGGFQTLYGQQGVQRSEEIQHIVSRQKRKTIASRIGSAFRRGKSDESEEY